MNQPREDLTLDSRQRLWRRAVLSLLMLFTALAIGYSFASRAIIFTVQAEPGADPLPESLSIEIDISGWSLRLGGNYLLLPGSYIATLSAPGYQSREYPFIVDERATQPQRVTLAEQPGSVTLHFFDQHNTVVPSNDGYLLINGVRQPLTSQLQLARGHYRIEISQPRYRSVEQAIRVEGRGVAQTEAIELTPAWQVRTLTSQPSGAVAVVDGLEVGTTPVQVELLESGSSVELSLPGYELWQQTIAAIPGSERNYYAQLEVERASLQLTTQPEGAAATLNGQYIGTTPLSERILVNQPHELSLHLPGFLPHRQNIIAKESSDLTLLVGLKPALGELVLTINVTATELAIDGAKTALIEGREHRLALPARRHQLTFSKPGYVTQTLTVDPITERTQQIAINLLTHYQAFWATRPNSIVASNGSELKRIKPSGSVQMGSPRRAPGRRANEGDYTAKLTRPYYIATTELTNLQFKLWREHNSGTVGGAPLGLDDQPVVNISWYQAAEYCNWLSDQEGFPRFYQLSGGQLFGINWDSTGYRLPTEAEWAYVSRSRPDGSSATYSWANQLYPPSTAVANFADRAAAVLLPFTLANYRDGFTVSAPVASFSSNRFSLFDLDGNVSEWVNDYYTSRPMAADNKTDSYGPESGDLFVMRGASWTLAGRSELRLAYRNSGSAGKLDVGFRLARFIDKQGVGPGPGSSNE